MQESSPQEIRSGSPPPPPATDQGVFALKRRFPGEASAPPATAPPPPPSIAKKTNLRRIVLPLVLLVLLVGGIAYVAQNLPSWRSRPPAAPPAGKGPGDGRQLLVFPATREEDGRILALWDANDKAYALEIEQGFKGHYDFVCLSASDQDVQVGLEKTECDCSTVMFAVLPEGRDFGGRQPDAATMAAELPSNLTWQTLHGPRQQGAVLPARRAGLVRVSWETRKSDGVMLNLAVMIWAQPAGVRSRDRQYYNLDTLTLIVPPLQFDRTAIYLGEIGGRGARTQFHCWSATRAKLDIRLADKLDPLFEWQITPLLSDECKELERKLNSKYRNTRVKSALRVAVEVHEAKDGRQLDQGSFVRTPPLFLDGAALEPPGTRIEGSVRGDVHIAGEVADGSLGEGGQIRFGNFKSSAGTRADLRLTTSAGVTLEYVDKSPPYLEVHLKEGKKGTDKRIWHLQVVVPRQVPTGPLPADSAVVLRKITQGAPPRQIRIPLLGNAVQR